MNLLSGILELEHSNTVPQCHQTLDNLWPSDSFHTKGKKMMGYWPCNRNPIDRLAEVTPNASTCLMNSWKNNSWKDSCSPSASTALSRRIDILPTSFKPSRSGLFCDSTMLSTVGTSAEQEKLLSDLNWPLVINLCLIWIAMLWNELAQ